MLSVTYYDCLLATQNLTRKTFFISSSVNSSEAGGEYFFDPNADSDSDTKAMKSSEAKVHVHRLVTSASGW